MMTNILNSMDVATAAHIVLGLAAGALVGVLHFATLRWSTALYLGRTFALAFGLQLVRLGVVGLLLFLLAHIGAGTQLAGALGLLAVRRPFLRRAGGWS
jgi:hypothetical protein